MSRQIQLLLALIASLTLSCGSGNAPKDDGATVHPKHKGPALTWLNLSHRDTFNVGDSALFDFRFVNDGWKDVWLTQVDNDGSYCAAEWPRQHLRIWDTAQVTLRCHFDHPGFIAQAIMVHYEGDGDIKPSEAALTYYAVVRDAKGNLPEAPERKRANASAPENTKE